MCNCTQEQNNSTQGFSIGAMAKSMANGFKDTLKQDFVSREVESQRLTACMTCPHRVNLLFERKPDKILKTDTCALCGCRLKDWIGVLPPKVKLKNSVCDSGRWPE